MKLHRRLFWLLILLLPTQIGRHFWPEWTQVLGLPIDYLSPTPYLTDILVVAILFFWWLDSKKSYTLKKHWWVGTIFLYFLVNSLLAQNSGAALYKFVKIIEFFLLGIYIAKEGYKIEDIRLPLSGAVIYSSLIAIIQFIKQSTIGGIFWWLGERTFSLMTPGIAKAIVSGRLVMRPYATFPHPNVLGGFVLISLILIGIGSKALGIKKILHRATLILGGVAIAISFSRSAWLVGLLVGLWFTTRSWWRKKRGIIGLILLTVIVIGLFILFTLSLSGREAVDQRLALIRVALAMIKFNPLAGVGLNNFIPKLPHYWQQFGITYWLQPVHNLFLLITAETGATGLAIFLWFLALTFKRLMGSNRQLLITALSMVLFLGLFDHYWVTLQQAQLLLTIVFGLSWRQ